MKIALTSILLFTCSFSFAEKTIPVTVDQRVELLSIVFRLAGNPEYNTNFAKSYVGDINTYFAKYKSYAVIEYARKLAEEKGIGYSKVMFLAVHLAWLNNKFSLIREKENTLEYWDIKDAERFVALLNVFYKDSKFQLFFARHRTFYTAAIQQFNNVLNDFDQKWYQDYYGSPAAEEYKIVIGLSNGGSNFGPNVHPLNQKKIVYAVMGSWTYSDDGKPLFAKEDYQPTLVHEFNHSFINHLLDEDGNAAKIKANGDTLLAAEKQEMKDGGYENWKSLINESIVRASVIRYMIDHKSGDQITDAEIMEQTNEGFIWISDLVNLLGNYESSRSEYPAFKDFYPRIITFFDITASNITQIKANYMAKQPKIISITPFNNNAQDVDPSLQEMTINFDSEIKGNGGVRPGELGKEHIAVTKLLGYENNNRSFKLALSLKPDTEYEFVVRGSQFKSSEGYFLQEYTVRFKTAAR